MKFLILIYVVCAISVVNLHAAEVPPAEKTLNVDSTIWDFVQKVSFDPPCTITQNKLSGHGIMYKIYLPKANTTLRTWRLGESRFHAELEMPNGQPNYAFGKIAAWELWKKAEESYKKQPEK